MSADSEVALLAIAEDCAQRGGRAGPDALDWCRAHNAWDALSHAGFYVVREGQAALDGLGVTNLEPGLRSDDKGSFVRVARLSSLPAKDPQ